VGDFSSAHLMKEDPCILTGDEGFRLDLKLKSVTVKWRLNLTEDHAIRQIIVDYEGPSGIWSCMVSALG